MQIKLKKTKQKEHNITNNCPSLLLKNKTKQITILPEIKTSKKIKSKKHQFDKNRAAF